MDEILNAVGEATKSEWQRSFESFRRAAEMSDSDSKRTIREERIPKEILEYQKEAVRIGVERRGRLWLCDEQGLGKTVSSLILMAQYVEDWPLLILAPKAVRIQWFMEAKKWLALAFEHESTLWPNENKNIQLVTGKKDCAVQPDTKVMIASYDVFANNENAMLPPETNVWKCIIFDESHKLKDPTTKRTSTIKRIGMIARRVVLLTGTPYVTGAGDLHPQLEISAVPMCRQRLPNFFEWQQMYCEERIIYTGSREISTWTGCKPEKRAEVRGILEAAALRRTKKSLKTQLPVKLRYTIYIQAQKQKTKNQVHDLTEKYQRLKNAEVAYQQGEAEISDRPPTHEMNALFADLAKLKVDSVCEWIDETFIDTLDKSQVTNDKKFLVFAHHILTLDALQNQLTKKLSKKDRRLIRIDGSTSEAQRNRSLEQFRSDPHCICALLSITACGTGLDLRCASTVIFAEISANFAVHKQAEDRVHRIGQTQDCDIYYCLIPDSLDDIAYGSLVSKLKTCEQVVKHTQPLPPSTPTHRSSSGGQSSTRIGESPSKRPKIATPPTAHA
uniref:Helicase ATP-binding domain-containing protein n=1 Tax=Aureoumbra lagunensis TaxID=44058 RepID=A0A7S3JY26_9STRA